MATVVAMWPRLRLVVRLSFRVDTADRVAGDLVLSSRNDRRLNDPYHRKGNGPNRCKISSGRILFGPTSSTCVFLSGSMTAFCLAQQKKLMLGNNINPSPSSDPFSENGSSSKENDDPPELQVTHAVTHTYVCVLIQFQFQFYVINYISALRVDPDAEVVSLSPKTLLESDRYVCEICNQGFQRDQNLQMHRRRHKVPWKLLKRETPIARKRVFVCPEPSCLHHDPCHALGDLVGIKKHFRRKHSNQKQWVCEKCSKGYAVQSDYKAHLKTCGTRGHSCDCGRVFSRVESFIEHQDACSMGRLRSDCHLYSHRLLAYHERLQVQAPPATPISASPHGPTLIMLCPRSRPNPFLTNAAAGASNSGVRQPNLELQLLTKASSSMNISTNSTKLDENHSTQLQLSIGSSEIGEKTSRITMPAETPSTDALRGEAAPPLRLHRPRR
ncbi:hypothetical protein DH2020_042486 [Rehmannia glutinosa]|uniref:C2H2-type domain-containing protein n=1 Tax=Rehmannia glutinosa TaxID=99300 RepID=A0ABR0UMS5_REHGL